MYNFRRGIQTTITKWERKKDDIRDINAQWPEDVGHGGHLQPWRVTATPGGAAARPRRGV
jgi:hypothetical protein